MSKSRYESQSTPNGFAGPICSTLPTDGGFYWWRQAEHDDWRMIQIVDCGGPQYLNAYDVQHGSFGGRGLKYWQPYFPVGEWIRVLPPNAAAERPGADNPKDKYAK